MSHSFTTSLDYEEYLAANWLMLRRRWLWGGLARLFVNLWICLFVLMVVVSAIYDELTTTAGLDIMGTALALAAVFVFVLVLCSLWRVPRSAEETWSQLHLDGLPTRHEFDAAGIRISNERGTSNFDWPMLTGWVEDDRLLLMFRTKLMFHAVPKAQVAAGELDALRAAMVAAGVSAKC